MIKSTGKVDIVIVNWNTRDLLRNCLKSIGGVGSELQLIDKIALVDNASTDGSMSGLDHCGGRLDVVVNVGNVGFAAACNQGARMGRAPFILFLNPDTEVRAGALERALSVFAEQAADMPSSVGVQLKTADGEISRSCARFPSASQMMAKSVGLDRMFPKLFPPQAMIEWDHLSTRRVDQVIGAFYLVRRDDFENANGFDERFFVYYEEVDFAKRMADQGRRALYVADVSILHHEHGSSGRVFDVALFYSLRSRILYARKHFRVAAATGVQICTLCLEPFTRVMVAICRGQAGNARSTVSAFRYLWIWLLSGGPRGGIVPSGR